MRSSIAALGAVLLLASVAHAQTLSPGKLGRAHEEIEGLSNCTKCHEFGKKIDGKLCLECHKDIGRSVENHKGFHGKLPAGKGCIDCHHDHRGLDASMTDWGGPKEKFDHKKTGFVLENKHAEAKCEKCHEARLVSDPDLKKRFGPNKTGTYMGLKSSCVSCHFDEHRGTVKGACDKCHDTKAFKPVPLFKHDEVFKLKDAHAKVECAGCHPRAADSSTPENAFPKPVNAKQFTRYKPSSQVSGCRSCHFDEHRGQFKQDCDKCHDNKSFKNTPGFNHDTAFKLKGAHILTACAKCHSREAAPKAVTANLATKPVDALSFMHFRPEPKNCAGCHKDIHEGKFGKNCARCHNELAWQTTQVDTNNPAFHDKSRFPLVGKHRQVECAACHPASKTGTGLMLKGFPFARCNQCHLDAHLGQIARDKEGFVACERCHQEGGFYPTRFPLEDHQKGRYPLQGSHLAVACTGCHKADPGFFVGTDIDTTADMGGRDEMLNFTRIRWPEKDVNRCDSCHFDNHGGQFIRSQPVKTCSNCHEVASFNKLHFNHDVDSSFHLNGGHAKIACVECHRKQGDVVAYRGAARDCAHCHKDVHLGQFVDASNPDGNCARCHNTSAFKPTLFTHGDTRFSSFELRGAHAGVTCNKCHPTRRENGNVLTWYRGVPTRCDGCHQNIHSEVSP